MARQYKYEHPSSISVAVNSYAEAGEAKYYPEKIVNGKRIIPLYAVDWDTAVDMYNCGKLHKKSAKVILDIMLGKADLSKLQTGGTAPAKVVGILAPDHPIPAGDNVIISEMDLAGANLAASKAGEAGPGRLLQDSEVESLTESSEEE